MIGLSPPQGVLPLLFHLTRAWSSWNRRNHLLESDWKSQMLQCSRRRCIVNDQVKVEPLLPWGFGTAELKMRTRVYGHMIWPLTPRASKKNIKILIIGCVLLAGFLHSSEHRGECICTLSWRRGIARELSDIYQLGQFWVCSAWSVSSIIRVRSIYEWEGRCD